MKDPRHRPRPPNAVRPPPPPAPPAAPNAATSSTQEADRRIAEAPRAWVALYGNRIMSLAEATAEGELAIRGVCSKSPFNPELVALVKLKPKEVG
jgi:hypothetical protein